MSFKGLRRKKKNGADKNFEELKWEANDEVYQLDTETLLDQSKRVYKKAKVLNKEQKKITRKIQKDYSEELCKCMEEYDNSLTEIQKASDKMKPILDKIPRKLEKTRSMREPRKSGRNDSFSKGFERIDIEQRHNRTGETSKVVIERQTTDRNEQTKYGKSIEESGTDHSFERVRNPTVATAELERRIKVLERDKENLQQYWQEERNAKNNFLQRLEQLPQTHVTVEEFKNLKQERDTLNQGLQQIKDKLQQEHQKEIYRLTIKCKSLEEAKENATKSQQRDIDMTRKERDQYKQQCNVATEDIKKLEQNLADIQREKNELQNQCKAERAAEKEADLQSLQRDLDRVRQEREQYKQQHMKTLQPDIDRVRQERDQYKEQYNTEVEKIKNLHRDLDMMRQERDQFKQQCNAEIENVKRLKQTLEVIQRERNNLNEQFKAEQEQKEEALQRLEQFKKTHISKESFHKLEMQIIVLTNENESLRQQLDSMDKTLNRNQQEKERISNEIEENRKHYEAEIEDKENAIRRLDEEYRNVITERDNVIKQYKAEKEAKDEAMNRLSSMASSKLRDNNPNITDLSDKNRPTKIAEKLCEMYDNQWTDAFDALERQDKEEREIIAMLLETLMTAYEECSKLANDNYFETVQRAIECRKQSPQALSYQIVMSDRLKQEIKEFRKSRAMNVFGDIKEIVLPRINLSGYNLPDIDSFVTCCIKISWLMAVQDPPLVFFKSTQSKFDTSKFKDYTKRGPFVEYLVWPPLLLHESGPLLSKGVAQGCDEHTIYQLVDQSKCEYQRLAQSCVEFPEKDDGDSDERSKMSMTFSGV